MSLLLLFSQGVNASAALTEADDSVASTATVLVSASSAITEADDTLASTATVLVSATAAITEAGDTLFAYVETLAARPFVQTFTVLGLGGYSRVPFGSFAGKPDFNGRVFVQTLTVLGLGGYSRVPWGSFAGRGPAATTTKRRPTLFISNVGRFMN